MADITLGDATYKSYASVAEADEYLAADAYLYASWDALGENGPKERPLISATRYLEGLRWTDGVPDVDNPAEVVRDSCSILAANIALKPKLLETLGSGENIKSVKAGSAEVEFFNATVAKLLPSRILLKLRDMLGGDTDAISGLSTPFDGGDGQEKCPDSCEYGLTRPYS